MKYFQKSILSANTISWLKIYSDYGINKDELIKYAHLDPRSLDKPDSRVPYHQHMRLLNEGMKQIHDPAIGLHIAEKVQAEDIGIIGQLALNSRDLREALFQLNRYSNLAVDHLRWEVREDKERATFIHYETVAHPVWARERIFAGIMLFIKRFSEEIPRAIEVRFQHNAPGYIQEYERIFGCTPLFSQSDNVLVFERRYLDLKLPHYNPYLSGLVAMHAESLLRKITKEPEHFRDQVKRIILENLHSGMVDIEMVCKELHISRWTLARRLKNEGTTFKKILIQTKRQVILNYLHAGMHPIHEIALLAGFTSQRAFYQFFREWKGKSPRNFIMS
jgi:AraC-like DNA-binding protein